MRSTRRGRALGIAALGLLLGIGLAGSASAVSITLAGPHLASDGDVVTFTVGLSAATSLNGYDLTVQWDTSELSLTSASQLFPDSLPPDTFGFTPSPVTGTPGDARAAALSLTAFSSTKLFSLTFDAVSPVTDGAEDIHVLIDPVRNGQGLSPPLPVDNPAGVGFDVAAATVPEPATAALLLAGLGGLTGFGGRRRR